MKKIAVIVSANVIQMRIDKLLPKNQTYAYEHINGIRLHLNKLEKSFVDIDLIIIDLDHSEIDSIQLISQLRTMKTPQEMPIIALGNNADIGLLKRAVAAGCDEFILKPFPDEVFIEKLSRRLSKQAVFGKSSEEHLSEAYSKIISETGLVWSDEFNTGIDFVDHEHRLIFQNYAKLYNMMREGKGHTYYKELLSFLKEYVGTHFAHEEQLLSDIGYPYAQEHLAQHRLFQSKLNGMYEQHQAEEIRNHDLIQINLFVKDWLIHHILIEDRKYSEYAAHKNKIGDIEQ